MEGFADRPDIVWHTGAHLAALQIISDITNPAPAPPAPSQPPRTSEPLEPLDRLDITTRPAASDAATSDAASSAKRPVPSVKRSASSTEHSDLLASSISSDPSARPSSLPRAPSPPLPYDSDALVAALRLLTALALAGRDDERPSASITSAVPLHQPLRRRRRRQWQTSIFRSHITNPAATAAAAAETSLADQALLQRFANAAVSVLQLGAANADGQRSSDPGDRSDLGGRSNLGGGRSALGGGRSDHGGRSDAGSRSDLDPSFSEGHRQVEEAAGLLAALAGGNDAARAAVCTAGGAVAASAALSSFPDELGIVRDAPPLPSNHPSAHSGSDPSAYLAILSSILFPSRFLSPPSP